MRAGRRWLYAAALASFAAGLSVGLVMPRLLHSVDASKALDSAEDYIHQLTDLCDLSARQVQDLRMILTTHERELRELRRTYFDQFPPIYREKYEMTDQLMDTRILGILDNRQREEYLAQSGQENK